MIDLIPQVFYKLCTHFFTEDGKKLKFNLGGKKSVSSDPFVDYLDQFVFFDILGNDWEREIANPNTSPDVVFYSKDLKKFFAIEVKTSQDNSSSINFNSTLPCGKIIIEVNGKDKTIPCYYLFVHLTKINESKNEYEMGSLMMVDGDFINSDFKLYKQSIQTRKKKIDIGSYKDGIDRMRNMYVFPTPLGISGLRKQRSTLVVKSEIKNSKNELGKVALIQKEKNGQTFYAYQAVRHLIGPFHNLNSRTEETKPRYKFKINSNE